MNRKTSRRPPMTYSDQKRGDGKVALPPPSDPQLPLNRSLGLIELLRSLHLLSKSSEDPSNVAVDLMGQLTPPP